MFFFNFVFTGSDYVELEKLLAWCTTSRLDIENGLYKLARTFLMKAMTERGVTTAFQM